MAQKEFVAFPFSATDMPMDISLGQFLLCLDLLCRWLAEMEIGYKNQTNEYVCKDTSFVHGV